MTECPNTRIRVSYQRLDTKDFHEMEFCDWGDALDFARWAHFSPETELTSVKVV